MSKKKIIIFDDDKDILTICRYILESMNWEVHTKDTSNNILETVSSIMPDVILMDNWVPDIGGVTATQILKADPELREVPVIFFSANHDIKILSEEAGADTYIMKPFDITQFEKVINSVYKSSEA